MAVAITRTSDPAGIASTAGNLTVYASATAGTAASDRLIIVPIGKENATPVVNRVTIDTGAGAVDMQLATAASTIGAMGSWVYWKLVPTGTAATVSITWSAAVLAAEHHVCLYAVTGANTGGLVSTSIATSTDMDVTAPLSATVTIATGGGAIAIAACASTTATKTWANMTGDLDEATANFKFVTSTRTTAGAGLAVTLTGNLNGEDGAMTLIVLGPTPTAVAGLGFKYPLNLAPVYPVSRLTWLQGTTALITPAVINYMPSRVTDWGNQPTPSERPPGGKFWRQGPQITPNPFSQESWPNPILPVYAVPQHPRQFIPQVNNPFRLNDWPVPQQPQYPVGLRTWIGSTTGLLGTAVVTYMPSRVTDWGVVPAPPQRPPTGRFWTSKSQIVQPRVGPFNQYDWPLPQYPHLLRRYDWLAQLNVPALALTYVAREATFQSRYPVPTVNLNWLPQSNLGLLSVPPAVRPPINLTDWPVPVRPRPRPDWVAQSNLGLLTAPVITYMPARVTDWGSPPVAVVLAQKSASSNIAALTSTPADPRRQTVWPLPIRTPPVGQFWTARPQITFVQPPFNQTSWPVPQAPLNITSQRTWISSTIGLLNATRAGPFNQSDWPLPIPPQYPTSGKTWIGSTIGLRSQVRAGPFNQFIWPVPTRPIQPGSVYFSKNSPIVIPPAPVTEVPVDTHDGVFDERKWRKYQERLRRQREQVVKEETARRAKLRAELVRLYRGIEETAPVEAKPALPKSRQEPLPVPVLDYIGIAVPQLNVQAMVAEYMELLRREQTRREQEDEDELETILMATLL